MAHKILSYAGQHGAKRLTLTIGIGTKSWFDPFSYGFHADIKIKYK